MLDYIPSELISDILARLPAEDVLRCTSVCKSWYSLITSPSFASAHLKLSSPNQEPRLLVENYNMTGTDYCLYRDNETFDEVAHPDASFHGYTVDSLNGLVCLYDDNEDTIVLWNPSLRKSFTLPKSNHPKNRSPDYGFGFIASSNEYKVLRLSFDYDYDEPRVEIYQLSTGTWRDLEVEDYSYFDEDINPNAHLDGVVHWYRSHFEEVTLAYSNVIYSFDMKTEKFGALMVPSCLSHVLKQYCEPSIFRESFSLIEYSNIPNIWVMKEYGIADSWYKLYSIDMKLHNLRFCHFRDNGELLFEADDDETHGRTTELVSYDCNNNQVKDLGVVNIYAYYSSV